MREEFKLIEKLGDFIADLRNCLLSIDAAVKLWEKGRLTPEESLDLIKGKTKRADEILDELRVMGF